MHEGHPMNETEPTLPEIEMQHELRESFTYKPSASRWYWPVVYRGTPMDTKAKAEMLFDQKQELPYLMSAVLERTCNLACQHCLYQSEKSSKNISHEARLSETIQHLIREMPERNKEYPAQFMSCGRILRPWHLELFENIRKERPEIPLGVIDNGTYTDLLDRWPQDFKFDWMSISIDGTPEHHDAQRGEGAFKKALEGLHMAPEILQPKQEGCDVSSLLTLTTLNAGDIEEVADLLLAKDEEGTSLARELVVTTMSPTNDTNLQIEVDPDISTTGEAPVFTVAWESLKQACEQYSEGVALKIYRAQDMEKLAAVVGEDRFMSILCDDNHRPGVARNYLQVHIDGVKVEYFPLSLWTPEEFLIEADSTYKTAYEAKFTLKEHERKVSNAGEDISPYTIAPLNTETNFKKTYEEGVDHWWKHFGHKKLDEEMAVFARIRERAVAKGFVPPALPQ